MSEAEKKPARPIEDKSVKATPGFVRVDSCLEVKEDIYPNMRIVRNAK